MHKALSFALFLMSFAGCSSQKPPCEANVDNPLWWVCFDEAQGQIRVVEARTVMQWSEVALNVTAGSVRVALNADPAQPAGQEVPTGERWALTAWGEETVEAGDALEFCHKAGSERRVLLLLYHRDAFAGAGGLRNLTECR